VGLTDVTLHPDYVDDEDYERTSTDGWIVLVARRPSAAGSPPTEAKSKGVAIPA
jgi:hypothetical protein